LDQLALLDQLSDEDSHYNPSLQFINEDTKHEHTITAMLEKGRLEFSWWYNRPVIKKLFFGLGGEKTKMVLDDCWQFNLDMTLDLLAAFLKDDYQEVRNRMRIK
jgi:hypothetical protein